MGKMTMTVQEMNEGVTVTPPEERLPATRRPILAGTFVLGLLVLLTGMLLLLAKPWNLARGSAMVVMAIGAAMATTTLAVAIRQSGSESQPPVVRVLVGAGSVLAWIALVVAVLTVLVDR